MFDDLLSTTTRATLGLTFLAVLAVGLSGAAAAPQASMDAGTVDGPVLEDHMDNGGNNCFRTGTYCDISSTFGEDVTFEDHMDNGGNNCFRTGTYC